MEIAGKTNLTSSSTLDNWIERSFLENEQKECDARRFDEFVLLLLLFSRENLFWKRSTFHARNGRRPLNKSTKGWVREARIVPRILEVILYFESILEVPLKSVFFNSHLNPCRSSYMLESITFTDLPRFLINGWAYALSISIKSLRLSWIVELSVRAKRQS